MIPQMVPRTQEYPPPFPPAAGRLPRSETLRSASAGRRAPPISLGVCDPAVTRVGGSLWGRNRGCYTARGGMAERVNAAVLKTARDHKPSGVRNSLPPPHGSAPRGSRPARAHEAARGLPLGRALSIQPGRDLEERRILQGKRAGVQVGGRSSPAFV